MNDDLSLLRQLAGLKEQEQTVEEDATQIPYLMGRLASNMQDLQQIAQGGRGSARGVIGAMKNLLDALEQSFPN